MSLFLGWLILLLIGTDLFVVSPLLPQIAHGFAVSPGHAGLMVTVFAMAYVVGAQGLERWLTGAIGAMCWRSH